MFSPRWISSFNHKIPISITYCVRSKPIKDKTEVSYDNIPGESEPANILAVGSHGGKLIESDASNPGFFCFQYENETGNFGSGLTGPQWTTFALDGTIQLSEPQPLSTSIDAI